MEQQFNESKNPYQVLKPGKVYFNYGPVSMVVMADKNGTPLTDLCCESFSVINAALEEMSSSLELMRLYYPKINPNLLSGMPLAMFEAVKAIGEPTLTPMVAVAGVLSDKVADWLSKQGATRVMVNNGGDIALRLAEGESVRVGVMSSLKDQKMDRIVDIKAEYGIGGIATSGLGGRGFTRGVAEGITVFAPNATIADGLATHMANCSYIESKNVITTKAGNINPMTDIKDLSIVVGVDKLTAKEEKQAIKNIEEEARRQKSKGNLMALCARIQDQSLEINMPGKDE